jgi:hypothetical protein
MVRLAFCIMGRMGGACQRFKTLQYLSFQANIKGQHRLMRSDQPDPSPTPQRWYDDDPVIPRALAQLRQASTPQQAQIALNIIKVILEHQLADQQALEVDTLETSVVAYLHTVEHSHSTNPPNIQLRRWYDTSQALSSAMALLQECPDDLKQSVIPTIARMIEDTLAKHGELLGVG